jgi:hypothetical protein
MGQAQGRGVQEHRELNEGQNIVKTYFDSVGIEEIKYVGDSCQISADF